MARFWTPPRIWDGEPCYIIGGGPSLASFDWNALRGRRVLGCNAACYMDPSLVPWVVFGDASFIDKHMSALEKYVAGGGNVVTNSSRFRKPRDRPPWLRVTLKQRIGLGRDRLGWNANTGASAINLALLFGANPIYLLGYDMQLRYGKANFHNAYNTRPNEKAYNRFIAGMGHVWKDLHTMFPGVRVVNLEDDTSALRQFPRESLKGHFARTLSIAKCAASAKRLARVAERMERRAVGS